MQTELGPDYRVIDEGLNGRTTVWDDPIEEYRYGKQHLIPLLDTHAPLDLVVIFLGTNDLKSRYDLTAQDVSFGAGLSVTLIGNSGTTYTNFRIVCGAGVHLTIQDVIIDDSGNDDVCPLAFTGSGNTLTLLGANVLKGGTNEPAVRVEDTAGLEIGGSGSLDATGGLSGAGVGGGNGSSAGSVSVADGDVTSSGGFNGAGIGGAYHMEGSTKVYGSFSSIAYAKP